VRTGYNLVEGIRRAWRNGGVSDLSPEIPDVTIRDLSIAVTLPRVIAAPAHTTTDSEGLTVSGLGSELDKLGSATPPATGTPADDEDDDLYT
jgi:hypothetical protein